MSSSTDCRRSSIKPSWAGAFSYQVSLSPSPRPRSRRSLLTDPRNSPLPPAYGQTGSGKTYTMCGDLEPGGRDAGILPRAVQYCFDRSREVSIQVQMLEIYNEELRDLLCSDNPSPKRLQICNDRKFGTTVPGLHLAPASEASEALACIRQGIERRRTSETKVNKASSRSHVLCFLVLSDAVSGEVISRIGMCDLAGSERQNKTGTSGHKLKEGGSINRSLSALERVVSGIHDYQKQKQKGSMSHVNFRDSKLTRILQPFLSGRGSSVFILCVSALPGNAHETLNTMKFGQRLQGISQQPFVLQVAPASPMSGTHRRNLEAEFAAAGAGDRQKQERDQAFARLLARECAWSLLSFVLYSSLSGAFRALWS
mmetsp:Transcript_392/g.1117  ORF Transcript_392/g.1117 Transcript_392/m.1117 type:complete len:370 (+) Transcript_392:269-1378(+)